MFSVKRGGMNEQLLPYQVFLAAATVSSFGGLAALIRSSKPVTPRSILSAIVYSAAMGLVISLLWYNLLDSKSNPYVLLGMCGLAGIGGVDVLDFVFQAISKGGINITLSPKEKDKDDT